jgi:hypothetical protein
MKQTIAALTPAVKAKDSSQFYSILKSALSSPPFSLSNASHVAARAYTAAIAPAADDVIKELRAQSNWTSNQQAIEVAMTTLAKRALELGLACDSGNFVLAEAILYSYALQLDKTLRDAGSHYGVEIEPVAMMNSRGANRVASTFKRESNPEDEERRIDQNLWGYVSGPGSKRIDVGLVDRSGSATLPSVVAGFDISYRPFSRKAFVGPEYQAAFGSIPIYDVRVINGAATAYRLDPDGTTVTPNLPS